MLDFAFTVTVISFVSCASPLEITAVRTTFLSFSPLTTTPAGVLS